MLRIEPDMIIDATQIGNLSRFVNHSCLVFIFHDLVYCCVFLQFEPMNYWSIAIFLLAQLCHPNHHNWRIQKSCCVRFTKHQGRRRADL